MNRIYWDIGQISMLTDELGASTHSHGMIQFFLALENQPVIKVGREKLEKPVCLRDARACLQQREASADEAG